MNKINSYRDLHVYKKAHLLVIEIYKTTKNFPVDERFGLIDQMRRSSVSVTSNIAEGFARLTAKDKSNFYSIARGSLFELSSQLAISKDLGYISENKLNEFDVEAEEISRMIIGLMKSAKNYI